MSYDTMKILPNLSVAQVAEQWIEDHGPVVVCGRTVYRYAAALGVWQPLTETDLRAAVQAMYNQYGTVVNGGRVKVLTMSPTYRNQVCDFILHHDPIRDNEFFRQAPTGVAVKNGFIQVSAHAVDLLPHSPDNRATVALGIDYRPGAKCERFLALLDKILPTCRPEQDLIRDFYGTALLGLATHYQKCLVLLGSGANGKSTLMEILEEALFDASERGKVEPGRWDHEYYVVELFGKKLNSIPELPTGEMLASEKFKAVIAGDEITGRRPTEKPTTFRPRAAHVFAVNELPDTGDVTEGFWRRFLMVPLTQKFSGEATKEAIKAEVLASERAGILNWAIEGAQAAVKRGGFSLPPSHESTKTEWQTHADPVRGFLEACCNVDTTQHVSGYTSMAVIYDAYKEWCRLTNRKASRNSVLGRRLKSVAGITSRHTSTGTSYNVRVKHPSEWKDIHVDFWKPNIVDLGPANRTAKAD